MEEEKRYKEIELSRKFAAMLNKLPIEHYNQIISAIYEKSNLVNTEVGFDAAIKIEKNHREENNRYDIFIPCTSASIESIIVEIKKGAEDTVQIKKYKTDNPTAIVVSIAQSYPVSDTVADGIVRWSWSSIASMLSGLIDTGYYSSEKLKIPSNSFNLDISFPNWRLDLRTQYAIEDFLNDLLQFNIIRRESNRILVVTGKKATDSTTNDNIYSHPENWDTDYKYVIVVFENKIQYVGELMEVLLISTNSEIQELITNGDRVISLKSYEVKDIKIGQTKTSKGAFTQSHRYFENFNDFKTAF